MGASLGNWEYLSQTNSNAAYSWDVFFLHGQFIDSSKLKSQDYLNQLNKWTEDHKMIMNQKKTMAMIFNFTDNHKFTTHLHLKGDSMKILGTIVNDRMSWDENCQYIIKKVNAPMQLYRVLEHRTVK